jgi:mannose-6-phosphate isomerase-like protein (cupin superfamily)
MGVAAFGLAVMDLPPNLEQYPEHDHSEDGQEEVYVTLAGRGEIEIDGERHPLEPDTIVMVGPGVKRKVRTGDEPLRLLAIGGVPGKPYAAPEITQLGVPDPMQQSN